MCGEPWISLNAEQQAVHDVVLRSVVSEIEYCRARIEFRRELTDVLMDLVDERLAVLSLVRLKVIDRHKVGALIVLNAAAHVIACQVGLDSTVGSSDRQ